MSKRFGAVGIVVILSIALSACSSTRQPRLDETTEVACSEWESVAPGSDDDINKFACWDLGTGFSIIPCNAKTVTLIEGVWFCTTEAGDKFRLIETGVSANEEYVRSLYEE